MIQKNLIKTSLIVLALGFSSCAKLTKKSVEVAPTTVTEEKSEPVSEHVAKAEEAANHVELHKDDHRIVGSAKIQDPHEYKGKSYYLYGAEDLKLENYYFDIPVVYNDAVKKWISYFLKRGRGFFERYSARAGRYAPLLGKILEDHGLPRDLIFLAMAESGFQNHAKSWARAVGPWQFMPYTGKRYGLKIDWYRDERRDPIRATIAAAKYLKKLYKDFGAWELAAAAYNAGEGKMSRAIRRYRTENFWKITKGRYLKSETKNYVPKIMALAIIGKNLKSFGFEDINFHEPLDFEEIDLGPMTDLYKVADSLDVPFEEIQRLNPEVLRWFTPPNIENYKLRVPVGVSTAWKKCCFDTNYVAADFQQYKIKGRSSRIADVAQKFRIKDASVLSLLNEGKEGNHRLVRGDVVVLPFREGQSQRDEMYADLYEKPRKEVRRRMSRRSLIAKANRTGTRISNPTQYYTVQRGDSLWSVARKTGQSMYTIIASNMRIIKYRSIRAGDKLAVR
jgi:membrane-bound lytic murein transglycosylase D